MSGRDNPGGKMNTSGLKGGLVCVPNAQLT
jgi:hypothetical protein